MGDPARTDAVPGVALVERISLREVACPIPSSDEATARDRLWDIAAAQNPALFDGPVTLAVDVAWDGGLEVAWARGTYRNFALRLVPGATSWLPALFVTVLQPTTDGRVVVGRMGASTAAPGRWQLPGGTVDPPPPGLPLTLDGLRAHAALELREEIGVEVPSELLELWLAIGADRGNVGLLFTAPPQDAEHLLGQYEALCAVETTRGGEPEFSRVVAAGLTDLSGLEPRVEYLAEVLSLHLTEDHDVSGVNRVR